MLPCGEHGNVLNMKRYDRMFQFTFPRGEHWEKIGWITAFHFVSIHAPVVARVIVILKSCQEKFRFTLSFGEHCLTLLDMN